MPKNYFESWGSLNNPINCNDLNQMSSYRCAKKFAIKKMFDEKETSINQAINDIVHKALKNKIAFKREINLKEYFEDYEKTTKINWTEKQNKEHFLNIWNIIFDVFFASKEFRNINSRIIEVDRAFIAKIDEYCIAGIADLIISGKEKRACIVDWKTSKIPMSQFLMDNCVQTKVYDYAMKNGIFFVSPNTSMSNTGGRVIYDIYRTEGYKNKFNIESEIVYCYLYDFLPAQKKREYKSTHYSTKKLANNSGMVEIPRGYQKGPAFYTTKPNINVAKLTYSIKSAVSIAQTGLFPERHTSECNDCTEKNRCNILTTSFNQKQEVLELMDNLGIEP